MAGYLGDKCTMVVHHLAQMTKNCGIYYIEKVNKKFFTPDNIKQAMGEGFIPCKFCTLS